jgi:hypothetical protein
MRRVALLAIAVGFLVPLLSSAPAHAQATRTWVSDVGDDANPCSRTAPCKTFAGAISKTATFGEINVIDPGGFGAVTITKSITIKSDHIEAGVLVAGTNGIVVNVPNTTDRVQIEGLDIEGLGSGINGVQITGNGTTTIIRCRINGFTQNGINLAGVATARAVVIDSVVTDNNGGFNIAGAGGAQTTGISIRTTYDNNPAFGLQVAAPSALIMTANRIFGVATAVSAIGGATVTSFGDNGTNGTFTPTTTLNLK